MGWYNFLWTLGLVCVPKVFNKKTSTREFCGHWGGQKERAVGVKLSQSLPDLGVTRGLLDTIADD